MSLQRRVIIGVGITLSTFAAGWLTNTGASPKPAPPAAPRIDRPTVVEKPPTAPPPSRAETPPTLDGSAGARPVLYPNIKLKDDEKELLAMTPEEAVAKGDAGGASKGHIARCMERLPSEPPALCQRIDKTMHEYRLASIKSMREFLTGTLEASKFQEQYHRNMIAFQVSLEEYLSFDQLMQYATVEAGDDPFLVLTGWGFALPPGYTIGEDILSRRDGEGTVDGTVDGTVNPTEPADNPRDPFTYGKDHWPGGAH